MTELWTGACDAHPVPRTARTDLRTTLETARARLTDLRDELHSLRADLAEKVEAELWCGPAKHGREPLRCLYVGQRTNDAHLRRLLFADSAEEPVQLGSESPWRAHSLARRHEESVDLVIVEVGWPQARLLPRGHLVMPGWVGQVLLVDDDWQKNLARMTQDGRNTIQRLTRQGLAARLVAGDAHVADRFYDELYVPHVRARHGAAASIDPRHIVRSMCRRYGLLEVVREGEPLAGAIMKPRGSTLHGLWDGFRAGLDATLSTAVTASVYYFNLRYAYERGFCAVDLGGSRGFLKDGVLRYKRKWGASLIPSDAPGRICFRVRKWTPAVAGFFAQNPVLLQSFRSFSARMLALGKPVTGADLQKLIREHSVPGLRSFEMCSEGGFAADARDAIADRSDIVLRDLSQSSNPGEAYCAA